MAIELRVRGVSLFYSIGKPLLFPELRLTGQ